MCSSNQPAASLRVCGACFEATALLFFLGMVGQRSVLLACWWKSTGLFLLWKLQAPVYENAFEHITDGPAQGVSSRNSFYSTRRPTITLHMPSMHKSVLSSLTRRHARTCNASSLQGSCISRLLCPPKQFSSRPPPNPHDIEPLLHFTAITHPRPPSQPYSYGTPVDPTEYQNEYIGQVIGIY